MREDGRRKAAGFAQIVQPAGREAVGSAHKK
jgi:hypothetical protein